MEFCDLGNLNNYLAVNTVDVSQRTSFMVDMARGLNYLHSQGIIHQHLKPTNVLLKELMGQIVCKISDYIHYKTRKMFDASYHQNSPYNLPTHFISSYSKKDDIFVLGLLFFAAFRNAVFEQTLQPVINSEDGLIYLNELLKKGELSLHSFIEFYFEDSKDMGELIFAMLNLQSEKRPTVGDVLMKIVEIWVQIEISLSKSNIQSYHITMVKKLQTDLEKRDAIVTNLRLKLHRL